MTLFFFIVAVAANVFVADSANMPRSRNRDLPLLSCDLCTLTTKNHFIFKRHRQRCVRENSSSAVGSTTHKSQVQSSEAEEFTEGNLSVEDAVQEEADESAEKSTDLVQPSGAEFTAGPSLEGEKTSRSRRCSLSDLDTSSVEPAVQRGSALNSTPEVSVQEPGDAEQSMEVDEAEWASTSMCSGDLPPPNVSRNYSCNHCAYTTNKSKEFLHHKIEQHKARIHIFSCIVCEYCSQYKHKLARHMSHAHNLVLKNEEIMPEYNKPEAGGGHKQSRQLLLPAPTQRRMKRKKVVSSKVVPKSNQSLENLLLKLRTKAKVSLL